MEMIILFIAPLVQLVLSALRVLGKIRISLGGIAVLAFVLSCVASFKSMDIVSKQVDVAGQRCGMPAMGILFLGLFMTLIASLLTWGVFYIFYRLRKRNLTS